MIFALSIFRYILYAFLWLATLGKVSFFLLPNLTEDVGFFESFVPVYELETYWGNETDDRCVYIVSDWMWLLLLFQCFCLGLLSLVCHDDFFRAVTVYKLSL